MNVVYVALGGAIGSVLRHWVGIWATDAFGARPAGTLIVNVVGSAVIGAFLGVATERDWPAGLVYFVAVGLLGGFTTFSAFSWQTLQLAEDGNIGGAALNVSVSIAAGLLAVWAGATASRAAL